MKMLGMAIVPRRHLSTKVTLTRTDYFLVPASLQIGLIRNAIGNKMS